MLQENVQIIVDQIKANRCVIILGPNMLRTTDGQVLQEALWKEISGDTGGEIEQDADELLLLPRKNKELHRMKYYSIMKDFYDRFKEPDDVYLKLAQIPCPIILSVNPDVRLFQAFKHQDFNCQYGFYNRTQPSQQEFITPDKDNPIVYNLFGSVREQDSLILTQKDLIDYLFNILGDKRLPTSLMYPIKKSKLFLFLGFDFDKWYLRLIIKLFNLKNEGGIALASGYSERTGSSTKSFYEDSFGIIFVQDEEKEYIRALHEAFDKQNALRTPASADSSFIKQKIRDLISADELQVAIEELQDYADKQNDEDLINQSLILAGRLSKLEREKSKGIISEEQFSLERNRIRESLAEIVKNL